MLRRVRLVLFALSLGMLGEATALRAQSLPRIEIESAAGATSPAISLRGLLEEKTFDELLRSGFPLSEHFRAELWMTGRWFDEIVDREEWDVSVRYDVIDRTYEVLRRTRDRVVSLGSYSRFTDARAASELAYMPSLSARAKGRKGYVNVQVDVQMVAISDLDELQRWLRGEAAPAVQGRRSPGTALTRGFRTLVTRLLGGEVRHLEKRSGVMVF